MYTTAAANMAMPTPNTQYLVFLENVEVGNLNYFLGRLGIIIPGEYEIIYNLRGIPGATGNMTVAIQRNSANIPSSVITESVVNGTQAVFSGNTIVYLDAGDTISMWVSSNVANALQISPDVGASVSLKCLVAGPTTIFTTEPTPAMGAAMGAPIGTALSE
jgi:hypothetical protein